MSGYELSRFVDLSQSDSEEFMCSICQDIFRNPVVANCCLQTFCEQCINEWLEKNNTCPYDRKKLKRSQLSRPSRAFSNILGKLKIRCIHDKNGCQEILSLDNLDNHQKSCRFEKLLCDKCFCEEPVDHDCVKSLLESKQKLIQSNTELKDELKSAKEMISSLKSEIESYLQTIQGLSNANELKELPKTSNEASLQISDELILSEARKYLDSPIVDSYETPKEIAYQIISVTKDCIKNFQTLNIICQRIKETVDSKFNGSWGCIALYNNIGNHYQFKYFDSYVDIKFGKLLINICKVYDESYVPKLGQLIRSGKLLEELRIIDADMNEKLLHKVKNMTFDSLQTNPDLSHACEKLIHLLVGKLGGNWHCLVYKKFFGTFGLSYSKGKYILFKVVDLNLAIFQAKY